MSDKMLKRMSRAELLEMLILAEKENLALKEQIAVYEQQLNEKRIAIDNVGSLAEASLAVNRVCEAADMAARQYLDNIRDLRVATQKEYDKMIEKVKQAEQILQEAEAIVRD